MSELFFNFIGLFTESAPWLLLGLLVAGIMKFMIPVSLLERHMAGNDLASVTKAAIIGAPLPLCSCGVIPAALGLRRAGASPSATVSFLVATPETGVDSISISYALLGPFMAIIRPISAILSAIAAGVMVILTGGKPAPAPAPVANCCAHSCCPSTTATPSVKPARSWSTRLREIWTFASQDLLNDIAKWLMIGLLLAAAVKTWVPTEFLTQWGDSLMAMLVMALVGIPMYICASASTPLAAGLLAAGVSPGAVLVFMLAGPATNLATIGMIQQELGKRVLVAYLTTIIVVAILMGYVTNWLVATFGFEVYQVAAQHHELSDGLLFQLSAGLLAILMLRNWLAPFMKKVTD